MRLDLVTERSQTAEVSWSQQDQWECTGTTVLGGERHRIKLMKKRFGGSLSIYPLDPVSLAVFNKASGIKDPVPLPEVLRPFVGSLFTIEGALGGVLRNQIQGIELLDEIPIGAKKGQVAFREALFRKLSIGETIAVFGALGFVWTTSDFEDFEELSKAREKARQSK